MGGSFKSRAYEQFVRDLVQRLLEADGLDGAIAQHDVKLVGRSGRKKQVDVYWQYRLGGIQHRVVIECRDYSVKLAVKHVEQLHGKLADLPGCRGVLVSREGFQEGAIVLAQQLGIDLLLVREPRDVDYRGLLRRIELHGEISQVFVKNATLHYDGAWYQAQPPDVQALCTKRRSGERTDTIVIRDNATGKHTTLKALLDDLPCTDGPTSRRLRWNNADVLRPGEPPLRLEALTVEHETHVERTVTVVEGPSDRAVAEEILTGARSFWGEDGVLRRTDPESDKD